MSINFEMPRTSADVAKRIVQVRNGSRDALGGLLEAYQRYLLRLAFHKLAPAIQAKVDPCDLVQDTFLEAVRDFPRFAGTTEQELLSWLRCILRNNVANVHRHYETDKRQVVREITLERAAAGDLLHDAVKQSEPPSRQAEDHEQNERLEKALGRLPKHHRQVLLLRVSEGWTFVQIAEKLDSTAEAVRKLCKRTTEELMKLLKAAS
jgi:RNA polymerase sigma-70 factor (ECF subfamily)